MARETRLLLLAALLLALLVWSGLAPYDRATWWMETLPIPLALAVMCATYRRFPLTPLLYGLIFCHALILMAGGAYTYARVPLGAWVEAAFHLTRNPYDKLGHLAQGFVPALVAREILLRQRHVAGRRMAAFLSICVALAISATYELVEWGAALAMGQGADEFLGTQGDPWDTQSDMFMALVGAIVAMLALARLQDRQIAALGRGGPPG
jgi:putative membrane protein